MEIGMIYEEYIKNPTSELAITIDIYSLVKICDFFKNELKNDYIAYNYFLTTHLMSIMNFIRYEVFIYLSNSNQNSSEIDKNLRYGIHQFRKKDFETREIILTKNMGITIDFENPSLDFSYIILGKKKKIYSTNILEFYINQNNFSNVNKQDYINKLMDFFYIMYDKQKMIVIDNTNSLKPKNIVKCTYKKIQQPYSFVSLIKNSKIKDKKTLLRLLIAYSQIGNILILCKQLIDLDIEQNNYIKYFFIKIISLVIDESLDNIDNYILYTSNKNDKQILSKYFDIADKTKNKIRNIRNNFHYAEQTKVFKNPNMNDELIQILDLASEIHEKLEEIVNIKYRFITFKFFKLLRWSEYGLEKKIN